MGLKVLASIHGIQDAATQRALRQLEKSLNEALESILDLQASSSDPVIGGVSSVTGTGAAVVSPTTGDVVVDVDLTGYSVTGHTHPESDVTGLVSDLAAKVPATRTISTTAPLQGGGDLSADRTLTIDQFADTVDGAVPAPNNGGDTTTFLRADGTWADPSAALAGLFGSGDDGDVVISSDTSLSRDMFYNNLTINSGVTLNPNGYRIFVKGAFNFDGMIACNGGIGGNGGSAGLGGTAGAGTNTGSLPGGSAGGAGGGQGGGAGLSSASSLARYAGLGTGTVSGAVGGAGQGGGGGANASGTLGAASGNCTAMTAGNGNTLYNLFQAITGHALTGTQFTGATGGGGGRGSAAAGEGGGGGAGGGAGYVVVVAYECTGGTIEAKGGHGGAADQDGGGVTNNGHGGGGGGGGGGTIVVVVGTGPYPTCDVSGGIGGGGSPQGGTAGYAGGDGHIERYRIIAAGGGGSGVVTDGNYGDITVSLDGSDWALNADAVVTASLQDNAVTLAKMAQVATASILGRTTTSTGDVEALTATQATALLDLASTSAKGLTPTLPSDATQYLDGTGAWSVPAGGGGGGGAAAFSGCSVYDTGTQSATTSTYTTLTYNSETYDTGGYHSTASNTSRLTAPSTGYYRITGFITFAANSTGYRIAELWLNGTTRIGIITSPPVNGDSTILNIAQDVLLTAGDYVELRAWQSSGGNLTVTKSASLGAFSIARLGT